MVETADEFQGRVSFRVFNPKFGAGSKPALHQPVRGYEGDFPPCFFEACPAPSSLSTNFVWRSKFRPKRGLLLNTQPMRLAGLLWFKTN
jgi:hypothetical protein